MSCAKDNHKKSQKEKHTYQEHKSRDPHTLLNYTTPHNNLFQKHYLHLTTITYMESTAWIFPLHFQLPYLPEATCFQQAGSSVVEGTSQAVLVSSDQQKVRASLSLFLKSEKIPTLLYIGKDLSTGPSMIFDLFPRPTGLRHRSQITEGPVLRPFSYTKIPHCHCT